MDTQTEDKNATETLSVNMFCMRTVLPPVDEATMILQKGIFGTCEYLLCLYSFSVRSLGFIIGTVLLFIINYLENEIYLIL